MKLRQLLFGFATYLPGVYRYFASESGGVSGCARYCYSVWFRHLVKAHRNGLSSVPRVVAEFGPGNSLGVGLAALLSGAETYYALDVMPQADHDANLRIFEELVALFSAKAPIPGNNEFPRVGPRLESYDFPNFILSDVKRRQLLSERRLATLRQSILHVNGKHAAIKYVAPWYGENVIEPESLHMIYSQAVLEYIDDLSAIYQRMYGWLKPLGFMSHQIDLGAHQTSSEWYGHWKYTDFTWNMLRGRRPFWLNREPHSKHIALVKAAGFDLVCDSRTIRESRIERDKLSERFKGLCDEDLRTSGVLIQAIKPCRTRSCGRPSA